MCSSKAHISFITDLLIAAVAFVVFLSVTDEALAAARSTSRTVSLERQISQEQSKAKARRDSLSRLTAEERAVDKDLAAAESRILRLEASLQEEEKKLVSMLSFDAKLLDRIKTIEAEMVKTEEAMTEVLRVLWELHSRHIGVKGRDLPDWPVTDREHSWSAELFTTLDKHRKTLKDQEKDARTVAGERAALARKVQMRIATLNKEKEELLQSRIRYDQRIAQLRKQRQDTEAELTKILELVQNLNLRLQAAEEVLDIAKAKGKLPWPADGKIRARYRPAAQPPSRGITIGLDNEVPVRAVHAGKIVHNDVLRGLGRVVIIMHGEDYYSLYAYLSDSSLRIGQEIGRGEVVGSSGFAATINGPGLYFELRHHQRTVNPEEWLRKS